MSGQEAVSYFETMGAIPNTNRQRFTKAVPVCSIVDARTVFVEVRPLLAAWMGEVTARQKEDGNPYYFSASKLCAS